MSSLRPRRSVTRPVVGMVALVAATGVALAACGEDAPEKGGDPPMKVADAERATFDLVVKALDIDFDQDHYQVAASDAVSIAYVERGDMIHSLLIADADGNQIPITQSGGQTIELEVGPSGRLIVAPNLDVTGTAELAAGEYELICDIAGHAEAGMTATLSVG